MSESLLIAFLCLSVGQVESQLNEKAQSAARLKLMKETAARFEIAVEEKEGKKLELHAHPVLRWDNHRSRIVDAATFLWVADHRPQVIGGMWIKDGHSYFDLQSLSAQPLTATVDGTRRWSTSRAGMTWQAVANGPPAAASRAERLRQMKQLAQEFSIHAIKNAPDYDEGSIWRFRLMAQPVYRYPEEAAVDGAIFAYAQGTDPEAYQLLEAREVEKVSRWHFGFAPACVWELHAHRGEREVWMRPMWKHTDTDTVYGLVGPFAVDQKLFPAELIKAKDGR
jgi:hypothetical protein